MTETVDDEPPPSFSGGFDKTLNGTQGDDDENCGDADRNNSLRTKFHKVINIVRLIIM